jgi:transposase
MPKGIKKPRRLLKKLLDLSLSKPDAEIFFFDEGRFGLKPVVGRCWARKGECAVVSVQPGYENFYMYSAVNPVTGEDISLFLPWVNTAMMNIFLENLGTALRGRHCLLVLDQAGWHTTDMLKIPINIELVYLPPYSPELNPVERLWQWLKRHSVRNRFYRNLDEVMEAVQSCLQQATDTFLKGLCRCNYLLHDK